MAGGNMMGGNMMQNNMMQNNMMPGETRLASPPPSLPRPLALATRPSPLSTADPSLRPLPPQAA